MADFNIEHEVSLGNEGDWRLCFQWGSYRYEDGTSQDGYRFVWRRPDGSLQSRGPARIPNAAAIFELLRLASEDGWFVAVEQR